MIVFISQQIGKLARMQSPCKRCGKCLDCKQKRIAPNTSLIDKIDFLVQNISIIVSTLENL